ncbi:winged helix-turn-helix domain-containing protein [Sutterella wadsworthensis]|uniref:winged helix-turn-helix domain-containing protein n=1 Tax=Sutterella wadsworthensis TaxID=40545 RepID=UPI0013F5AF02|nr:winged helix-turn-helix domain-containing protein [Sutterella wadsworthensis]
MLGEIWKIGDWSVFPAENTLRRDGSEVKVPPRLMDALIFFARHPDHVISRTELVAHLWNRSVVTDQTVTQNIFELRKALRDGRGRQEAPEYIATVPKRGYQLLGLRTAQTEEPQPDAVSAEGASEAELGPPAQAAAGQTKSQGKRSKFMDFARSFLLDEVELGFKKYPY